MILLVSEILLLFHFSIIFSLTVLCIILLFRTADVLIKDFLHLLIPLTVYLFIAFMVYFSPRGGDALSPGTVSALSLFGVIAAVFSIIAFTRGVSLYLVNLLSPEHINRKLADILINTGSVVFVVLSFYFTFSASAPDWEMVLRNVMDDLYVYSSLILVLPTIVATFYFARKESSSNSMLLSQIMIAFYPLVLFAPLDLTVLRNMPFKLINISYMVFAVQVYQFLVRHYIFSYETGEKGIKNSLDNILSEYELSRREREIAELLIEGKSNREIAEILFISSNTVKTHVKNIYRKLEVKNRVQLVYKAKITP